MRIPSTIVAVVAGVAAALALAAPALALPPGVYVSPGSPAGKEYGFPLSVLRAAATGHSAPEGSKQPLFGKGITPGGSKGGGSSRASGSVSTPTRSSSIGATTHATHRRKTSRKRARSAGAVGASGARRAQRPSLASLDRPSSSAPPVALITLLVVLGGLALGAAFVIVRRRRS
jgi:hypothetical protein